MEQIVEGTFPEDVMQIVEVPVPHIMETSSNVGGETTPCCSRRFPLVILKSRTFAGTRGLKARP